jgi:hypothetical protein
MGRVAPLVNLEIAKSPSQSNARREQAVQLRRRAGDRHHEGEAKVELQRRARAVRFSRGRSR